MYIFYDSDEQGNEIPFSGQNFENFLDMCFQYSDCFSFMYDSEFDDFESVAGDFFIRDFIPSCSTEILQIPNFLNSKADETIFQCRLAFPGGRLLFFRCCEASKKMILDFSRDLWEFSADNGSMPEDLTFYRTDGSTFFTGLIHEGEAFLFPKDTEVLTGIPETITLYPFSYQANQIIHS